MIGFIRIREIGATPGVTRRKLQQLKAEAYQGAGLHWASKMLPRHFGNAASRLYGYTPRVGERGRPQRKASGRPGFVPFQHTYTGRKLREFGHTRPLELTGESRARAMHPFVRANSKRVRIPIDAPTYNLRKEGRDGRVVNMRDEITRVLPQEEEELARVWETTFRSALNRITSTKTETIR